MLQSLAMTSDDYEEQKRRLVEQRRILIEMAETAFQYQMRALDTVRRMMSGEGTGELLPARPAPSPPPAAKPTAPRRRRLGAWELYNDIVDALPRLPETFSYSDVGVVLGYEADRGSLHRTLLELSKDGHIAVESKRDGNYPTRYRAARARPAAGES
jgi:hypothetical protein